MGGRQHPGTRRPAASVGAIRLVAGILSPHALLQLSITNHVPDEIRRPHGDGVFTEGWALYTEEMLTRAGFYPDNSPAYGQVLRPATGRRESAWM